MTRPGQAGGGFADTLDIRLDEGLVIDATVKVSLIAPRPPVAVPPAPAVPAEQP